MPASSVPCPDLAQRAEGHEHAEKPEPRREAREGRGADGPAARDGLGLGQHCAVRDDQRNEQPEHLVELIEQGIGQKIDARDERGDDQHEQRYPH